MMAHVDRNSKRHCQVAALVVVIDVFSSTKRTKHVSSETCAAILPDASTVVQLLFTSGLDSVGQGQRRLLPVGR